MSVSEKAVLRVSDLLDWITNPSDIEWDRGILGVCHDDCVNSSNSKGLSAKKDKSRLYVLSFLAEGFSISSSTTGCSV